MTFKVKWKGGARSVINRRIIRDGATALFMAETWRRLYNPFVPMDSGFLANDSVTIRAKGSTGYIHHRAVYAAPIYYNRRGASFSTAKHALASARWDEAAKRAGRYKVLIQDVSRYLGARPA